MKELLPEAFAVIKETSRRFRENARLELPATDFERQLAAKSDAIDVEGDKAVWHNEWTAAGSQIKWDMVHYDVQLIGGIVLHQG